MYKSKKLKKLISSLECSQNKIFPWEYDTAFPLINSRAVHASDDLYVAVSSKMKGCFLENQDLINLKFSGEKAVDRKEPSGSL